MPRLNKSYDEGFKQRAIKLALKSDSIKSAAIALGIAVSMLHTGVKKVKEKSRQQAITKAESLFNKDKINK